MNSWSWSVSFTVRFPLSLPSLTFLLSLSLLSSTFKQQFCLHCFFCNGLIERWRKFTSYLNHRPSPFHPSTHSLSMISTQIILSFAILVCFIALLLNQTSWNSFFGFLVLRCSMVNLSASRCTSWILQYSTVPPSSLFQGSVVSQDPSALTTTAPQCRCADIDECSAQMAKETDRCKKE